jgi:DNA modification methylase
MIDPSIVQGDCIEVMSGWPPDHVDLVIADPPYNLGKEYGNGSDSRFRDEYLRFTKEWLSQAIRVLKPTGSICVFMGFRFISRLFLLLDEDFRLRFNGWITWFYTQGMGRTRGFSPRHDDILYFTKSDRFTFNLDSVRVPQKYYRSRNNMRGANPGDVWEFSHVHYCHENRTSHPTQKPEGLIERIVLAASRPTDLVVDPFAGSGTTLRVCQQLDRRSIGIELSDDYVSLIRTRLAGPFNGFDSIDPRMKRIPNDLNDPTIRAEYVRNHSSWFLSHHEDEIAALQNNLTRKYPVSGDEIQRTLFPDDC